MNRRVQVRGILLVGVLLAVFAVSLWVAFGRGDGARWPAWGRMGTSGKLARVDIEGIILDSDEITKWLRRYRKDESIKGVLVRIDSEGGAVGPSQEIYSALIDLKAEKPVVASLGSMATSGGYYVASAASRIVANPGTLTGNIGVILGYTHFERLLDRLSIDPVVVKSGARKDVASPLRAPSEEDVRLLQALVDDVHRQFVEDVTSERSLSDEALSIIADGRPLSGAQAMALGLVDQLGSLEDAVDWLKDRVGITGEPVFVSPPKPRPGLMEWLFSEPQERFASKMFKRLLFFGPVFDLR